jgi:hypothetical protein
MLSLLAANSLVACTGLLPRSLDRSLPAATDSVAPEASSVSPSSFDSPLPAATDAGAQEARSVSPNSSDSPLPTPTGFATPESPASQSATQSPPAVSADMGAIVGTVRNRIGDLPADAKVFVARFVWNDAKTVGVFYLDPANFISAPVGASGAFQVPDLKPADYVLLIGVTPENATPIMGDNNQARVIAVQAGQVVDLGAQTIDLQQNPQ